MSIFSRTQKLSIFILFGAIILPGAACLAALNEPKATSVSYIDMEFPTSVSIFQSDGYYYLKEDGYDHLVDYDGVGFLPELATDYSYSGNSSLFMSVGSAVPDQVSRCELVVIRDQTLNVPYYSSFAMLLPSDAPPTSYGAIFWQCWQYSDGSPPLAFDMDPQGTYQFKRTVDETEGTVSLYREYPPDKGVWHRYFVDYKLKTDSTGSVRVWVDGKKKLDFEGKTAHTGGPGIPTDHFFTKFGIYRYHDPVEYSSWFDSVRWGTTRGQVWYGSEETETVPSASLLGEWALDEWDNSNIAMDSSEDCHYVGEVRNGGTRVTGAIGGAVSLDGIDDYISIPDSVLWDTGGKMTVSCRFKTASNQSGKGLVLHDMSNDKYELYLTGSSSSVQFYVRTASGVSLCYTSEATGFYADNQWHHLVGVYDKTLSTNRLKLYVDGVLAATANGFNEDITAGDEGITIGRYATNYFQGLIDDVQISNYAFSPKEVSMANQQNVIGHWNFDLGTSTTTAVDSSIFNNPVLLMDGAALGTGDGESGRALSLDGGGSHGQTFDYYFTGQSIKLWNTGDKLTVSCRFKTTTNQSGKGLVLHDIDGESYLLYLTANSSSLQFYVRTAGGFSSCYTSMPTGYYADGNWHHVVGVYDNTLTSNRLKLYVDGVPVVSSNGIGGSIVAGDEGISIGRYGGSYFSGSIDDVAIYRNAFSVSDVAAMYNGPICYYDCDETGSDVVCDSGFRDSPKGILKNGASWTTGHSGSAVLLDGTDDYVQMPESATWNMGGKFSVACKFKTSANQSGKGLVTRDNTHKYMLYLTANSSSLQFYVRTASGVTSCYTSNAAGYYADNQWHSVVGVYDRTLPSNRLKIYVDGVLAATANGYNEAVTPGSEGFFLGQWNGAYFGGAIDDVRLYNRALTPSEVTELYPSLAGVAPVLIEAVSRKSHGGAGSFDIPLNTANGPQDPAGPLAVECRSAESMHVVATFDKSVVAGQIWLVGGTATVSGAPAFQGNQVAIHLTGVANAQTVKLCLQNIRAAGGNPLPAAKVGFRTLLGDVNGDGTVSTSDVNLTRTMVGSALSGSNFRGDVKPDGEVSTSDVNVVRAGVGKTAL